MGEGAAANLEGGLIIGKKQLAAGSDRDSIMNMNYSQKLRNSQLCPICSKHRKRTLFSEAGLHKICCYFHQCLSD